MRDRFHIRIILALGLACLMMSQAGCSWMARRTFKEAKGAKAEITLVPGATIGDFSAYDNVSCNPPRTRLGGLVPGAMSSTLPNALRNELTQSKNPPFAGGGRSFAIDSEIMWYHERSGLGVITGSDSYAVVLLEFNDSGRSLGRMQVVSSSGASRTGPEDMAEAVAKEVADWFYKQKKGRDAKRDDDD